MIYQKLNSVEDRLYFNVNGQSVRIIPKPDNYNKYDYN